MTDDTSAVRSSPSTLEPVRGSEADKRRPAVVVSNDTANATATRLGRGAITVVPVTSNVGGALRLPGIPPGGRDRAMRLQAQAEQVRSIAIERVGARLGIVPEARMDELDEALRLHLGLRARV